MHGKHGPQIETRQRLLRDHIRVLALEVAPRSAPSFKSGCRLILEILRRCRVCRVREVILKLEVDCSFGRRGSVSLQASFSQHRSFSQP